MRKIIFMIVIMFFLFLGAESVSAQEITPTATLTITPTLEWDFPAEGLQPYTYTVATQSPISYTLNRDDIWKMARVALTTYNIMGLKTWAFLGIVIIVPIAAAFVFRIFINPPEI